MWRNYSFVGRGQITKFNTLIIFQELVKLLEGLKQQDSTIHRDEYSFLGVGLDSCVLPTRHKDIKLVQTTDFFYPLVDDPYMQGKIACANVLSDLYATGVWQCDNMLMLLGGWIIGWLVIKSYLYIQLS